MAEKMHGPMTTRKDDVPYDPRPLGRPPSRGLLFLASLFVRGEAQFGAAAIPTNLLLVFSGVVTATPLLFFAAAAHQIPLSSLGLLQYIAPTLQFLIGVFLYHEPFPATRLIGFIIIWIALSIYMVDNINHIRAKRRVGSQVSKPIG